MSSQDFSWLPPVFGVDQCSGDNIEYIEQLYNGFKADIINGRLEVFGKPVIIDQTLVHDGKHERFWHIITDPHDVEIKSIKYSRAERVCWIKPILENYLRNEVLVYERYKENDLKLHLFIPEKQYMVILVDRGNCYFLVTAFYIDYTYKIKEYEKEHQKYGPKTKTAA